MSLPPIGLYIHLPWCERKCPYCDFNSHEASNFPEDEYVAALLRDLRHDLPLLHQRTIDTLFIGGGTPSLFSGEAIHQLMQGIATLAPVSPQLEATMEANPGSAEAEKFLAFREAGINRLSLGIQSFRDQQLEALGRVHNSDQAHAAIEYAVNANFNSFNIDLMHGLPNQSIDAACADLDSALQYQPEHLSWYQLTIEPNTVFHSKPPTLPVEDALADIQLEGEKLLAESGLQQYEVSAYSRSESYCQHNRNYWSFGDYLGIGAGAHGKITSPDGSIQRQAKKRQPKDYLAAQSSDFVASKRKLDRNEAIGEFMLNALRLNDGFSLSQFTQRTGVEALAIEPKLDSLCERELLVRSADSIRASEMGRRFLDTVIGEFFS
jgi:putative oxygen-independent coproporphyrinogen III oxidase